MAATRKRRTSGLAARKSRMVVPMTARVAGSAILVPRRARRGLEVPSRPARVGVTPGSWRTPGAGAISIRGVADLVAADHGVPYANSHDDATRSFQDDP